MKRLNPTFLLILSAVALLAYTTKPVAFSGVTAGEHSDLEEERLVNKVKLETAKKNVLRYDDFWKKHRQCSMAGGLERDSVPIRAFKIGIVDLMEALEIPFADTIPATYKHIRVYLGLDEKHKFKLYITPVSGEGKDCFLHEKSHETGLVLNHQEYVLDLNAPCPTTCDDSSQLYKADQ